MASPSVIRTIAVTGFVTGVALLLAMVLQGHYSEFLGRLLLTALGLSLFACSALSPSIVWRRNPNRWLGPAGMLAPVLGLLLVTIGIWAVPDSDAFWKAIAIITILTVAIAYCYWFLAYPPGFPPARLAARVSVGAAASAALLASVGVILEIKLLPWWWVVALLILIMPTAGLAVPLLSFLAGWRK